MISKIYKTYINVTGLKKKHDQASTCQLSNKHLYDINVSQTSYLTVNVYKLHVQCISVLRAQCNLFTLDNTEGNEKLKERIIYTLEHTDLIANQTMCIIVTNPLRARCQYSQLSL